MTTPGFIDTTFGPNGKTLVDNTNNILAIVDAKILKPTKTINVGGSLYAVVERKPYVNNLIIPWILP